MKRLFAPLLVIVALIGLALWGAWQKTPRGEVQAIPCENPMAGCAFLHEGLPATLRFSVQPEALKPFVLSIASPRLREASVSFQMVGMDMGFNRYDLRQDAEGNWSARVTLPVCTVSRVDWTAEITLDGRHYALAFDTR
ncbi:hypothetical protein F8A87_07865 [Betaproteobacteria bacterium SCN2]|jgi:hypothetical protein|nr:hypothetical protein F8A87_07865 [Betaproteobacteria bacterium SCN2]